MEKEFIIKEGLANATLNYLAQQPYVQVYQLIEGFKTLGAKVEVKKEETKTSK